MGVAVATAALAQEQRGALSPQDLEAGKQALVKSSNEAVRSFAEAKSPTELVQLQTEFARAQFDRFVAESSRLTETFVKLAGEAIQPIQSRATLNAERINKLVA